jgi:hypothetical protein
MGDAPGFKVDARSFIPTAFSFASVSRDRHRPEPIVDLFLDDFLRIGHRLDDVIMWRRATRWSGGRIKRFDIRLTFRLDRFLQLFRLVRRRRPNRFTWILGHWAHRPPLRCGVLCFRLCAAAKKS